MTATYSFQESTQKGILCLAKFEESFLVQVMPMIKADYFEFPCHGRIWDAIVSHYLKYKETPNDDQIIDYVKANKSENERLSDYKYEVEQINKLDVKTESNPDYYLDLVEEFAKEQSIKTAILESVDLIKGKQFSQIEEKIRLALNVGRTVDLGQDYIEDFSDRVERMANNNIVASFRTPFDTVNKELEGGMCRKEFAMVVAPPGVGKSIYLVNQAVRSVLDGHNVLYVSLEMSEDRIAQRMDSVLTRTKLSEAKEDPSIVQYRLKMIQDKLGEAGKKMGTLKIKEFPTKRLTIPALRAYLNQLDNYENFRPDVLVVDYLELMTGDDTMSEYQIQERLAQELRGIAVEHNLLLWTATQTNREGRKVETITDTELADSYGKIRVADLSFSINQKEEEFDKGEARLYLMKSRNGRARYIVPLGVDYSRLIMSQK